MSSLDLQEQEQVEELKAWWKENGKWIIGVLVVGIAWLCGHDLLEELPGQPGCGGCHVVRGSDEAGSDQ